MRYLSAVLIFIYIIFSAEVGFSAPVQPALELLAYWRVEASVGVVLAFYVDGYGVVEYAHSSLTNEPAKECNETNRKLNGEIELIVPGPKAWKYLISENPVLFRQVLPGSFSNDPRTKWQFIEISE